MNKQSKIILAFGIIITMFILVWFFSSGEEGGNKTTKRLPFVSTNWTKKFQPYDKDPLGLYLFNKLLVAHLDTTNKVIELADWIAFDSLVNDKQSNNSFIFVGNQFGLQNAEIDTLISRVYNGSQLFLSFNSLTENINDRLLGETKMSYDYDDAVHVFSEAGKTKMINLHQTDTVACKWNAFGSIDKDIQYTSKSSFMEMSNFIEEPYGSGLFFLHANPNMFYNYQLKRKDGFKYASFVIDQIPRNQNIYLLELGRLTDNYGNYDIEDEEGPGGKQDDSYLQLIFQSPTLVIALLLSIAGVILFVIFRSKRMRPVVPYVKPKKDMTMAFTETITSIYFSKRNPYGLLQVQRKNFYSTIQRHFFLDLQRRESNRVVQTLAEKSNTPIKEIESILGALETKEASSITDTYVSNIQKQLHNFYYNTGIISAELKDKVSKRELVFKRNLWLPALFIVGGIYCILQGMYLLVHASGVGIALWPIGITLVILGILRLSKPYLVIEGTRITYYTPLGKKKTYDRETLIGTELRSGGTIFKFSNNKPLIIKYWDMSLFDKKQFQAFLSKLNILES